MTSEIVSTNPAARAVIGGTAPRPVRLAAARAMLPLGAEDLFEVLVALATDEDAEIAAIARETFEQQDATVIRGIADSGQVAVSVLGYLAENYRASREVQEAVAANNRTPDAAIISLARAATDSIVLETISINQQRLVRAPAILDALLANPGRNAEVVRRIEETRREFFEKSRGAQQIAEELRARGETAAAEFIETAEFVENLTETATDGSLTVEDAILLASHIEVPDDEVDDSWLDFALIEDIYEESEEQRRALAEKVISESLIDGDVSSEKVALIRRIMLMPIKDRVKLGMKGDREARGVLIRDPNRVVAGAVLANARITEQEVEKIAAMRTVPDEVLRNIGNNRTWARNYTIIHNLVRNPRAPLPTIFTILPRIQTKDLRTMSGNRNISEAVRKQATRLLTTRK